MIRARGRFVGWTIASLLAIGAAVVMGARAGDGKAAALQFGDAGSCGVGYDSLSEQASASDAILIGRVTAERRGDPIIPRDAAGRPRVGGPTVGTQVHTIEVEDVIKGAVGTTVDVSMLGTIPRNAPPRDLPSERFLGFFHDGAWKRPFLYRLCSDSQAFVERDGRAV